MTIKQFLRKVTSKVSLPHIMGPVSLYKSNPNWAIGIYAGESPFRLHSADNRNPVFTASHVTGLKAAFVADPFMVHYCEQYYMFFEIMDSDKRKPCIGLAASADGYQWKYERVVLEESFVLSYPYVFESEGDYYMLPEAARTQTVRLYRARHFPYEWQFVKTLLEGRFFCDPSIVHLGETWWLFVAEGNNALRLYHAHGLFEPWLEHPKSPLIQNDASRARPGGRILRFDGGLYRFAQDDTPYYGRQIRVFKILTLSPTDYGETELAGSPIFGPAGYGWNKDGMHNIDLHRCDSVHWIACVDGYRKKRSIHLSLNIKRLSKANE